MAETLTHAREHNAPPPPAPLKPGEITAYLDYEGVQLIARRNEITAKLNDNLARHPTINDDETLGNFAENVRMAKVLGASGEEQRVAHKRPFLTGERTVDGWFKAWKAPLDVALAPVQKAMDSYAAAKIARERAQAEAERKRAQAEADAAAERASQQLRQGHSASDALDVAATAAQAAEDADSRAQAKPADLTRTYGSFGAVASAREVWKWRVTDEDLIPRRYLVVSDELVKQAAKKRDQTGKPIAVIPGIEWYSETKMGVR
jgi:hypothetical protein